MRFVYVTDLHGRMSNYEKALEAARNFGADLIVNGGDMLPKTGDGDFLENQRNFMKSLEEHLLKSSSLGIRHFAAYGNDDCMALLPALEDYDRRGLINRLDRQWMEHGGWHFIAFPWVPDTPFLLKDWCLLDHRGWKEPPQFGPPLLSTESGIEEAGISNESLLLKRETIEQKLSNPPFASLPAGPEKCIFVMHSPPAGSGLDVTWDGREIGSKAGREYIIRNRFKLSLHGHVHESPDETGLWASRIGDTLAINPGVNEKEAWVVVDTDVGTASHVLRGTVAI